MRGVGLRRRGSVPGIALQAGPVVHILGNALDKNILRVDINAGTKYITFFGAGEPARRSGSATWWLDLGCQRGLAMVPRTTYADEAFHTE